MSEELSGDLKSKIQSTLTTAMKARESQKVLALRNITSAIKKREVDERKEMTSADVEKILRTLEKQLKETLDQAKGAGREESIREVEFELEIISSFLPKQMTEAELLSVAKSVLASLQSQGKLPAGAAAMGAMMKEVMAQVGNRADGKAVQNAVKQVLG